MYEDKPRCCSEPLRTGNMQSHDDDIIHRAACWWWPTTYWRLNPQWRLRRGRSSWLRNVLHWSCHTPKTSWWRVSNKQLYWQNVKKPIVDVCVVSWTSLVQERQNEETFWKVWVTVTLCVFSFRNFARSSISRLTSVKRSDTALSSNWTWFWMRWGQSPGWAADPVHH